MRGRVWETIKGVGWAVLVCAISLFSAYMWLLHVLAMSLVAMCDRKCFGSRAGWRFSLHIAAVAFVAWMVVVALIVTAQAVVGAWVSIPMLAVACWVLWADARLPHP